MNTNSHAGSAIGIDHYSQDPACSCPSGNGSLRWPCRVHPPVAVQDDAAIDPDHDPIDELVDVIDVTPQPEPEPEPHHTDVADSEGGHHD